MRVLAIDPGPTHSAWVEYDSESRAVLNHGKDPTGEVADMLRFRDDKTDVYVIEGIASYGRPVGAETFETCYQIGRMLEILRSVRVELVERREVKAHLCDHQKGVTDAVIRQRLIDLFGPGREKAVGKKKSPGPLHGVKVDEWQALALAVTYAERKG